MSPGSYVPQGVSYLPVVPVTCDLPVVSAFSVLRNSFVYIKERILISMFVPVEWNSLDLISPGFSVPGTVSCKSLFDDLSLIDPLTNLV